MATTTKVLLIMPSEGHMDPQTVLNFNAWLIQMKFSWNIVDIQHSAFEGSPEVCAKISDNFKPHAIVLSGGLLKEMTSYMSFLHHHPATEYVPVFARYDVARIVEDEQMKACFASERSEEEPQTIDRRNHEPMQTMN